ncbi:MAG: GTP-binding protein [Rhodospirillaceae bacterium]|jgi:G3E family GTPase
MQELERPEKAFIPLTVITGFLGSGKTTLLNRILKHPGMENAAVIINEFGDIALDHELMTTPNEDVMLLSSGCLCCSVRGDLVDTLSGLLESRAKGEIPPFDRVLVETTGLADPVPVLMTVISDSGLGDWFFVDGVITVVDSVHALGQFDDHYESVKQVAVADRIFITKTDLSNDETYTTLCKRIEHINPGVVIDKILHGEVDPDTLFGLNPDNERWGENEIEEWLKTDEHAHIHDHDHSHASGHKHAHHDENISSYCITYDKPVMAQGLEVWFNMLSAFKGSDLLRMKGIVNVEGTPIVVQAVQHLFHPPVELDSFPGGNDQTRIVFITNGIAQETIEETLSAFEFSVKKKEDHSIDPESFAKFMEVAKHFR